MHGVHCMIENRTNPNTEAKQNMLLLPKLPSLPADSCGVGKWSSASMRVSLLNEFSIFSQGSFRAAGKHLPILSALTHSVFTRCPELDPITETKILSDSKVVNLTPTNMTSCHMDFMIILVEFHVSSIQGIPTYWRNWKLLHAVFINIGSWKNKRKKGKDSLYKSKWEFLFHLLDWWKIKCWMISTADGDGKKVFL